MTNISTPEFSQRWVNLTSHKLGAVAVACSDDFFADMGRMLGDHAAVFIDGKYDTRGKWMDGWESRRKRGPGHDWCVVKLAAPAVLRGVEIDTTHFTGNYPPAASLEACHVDGDAPAEGAQWQPVLAQQKLSGDCAHRYAIESNAAQTYTHVRLNIFPDGGVARLRVYGAPQVDWAARAKNDELTDLAAALNGAVALCCNDEHFGAIRNLLNPGRGENMGDGWETRRRRTPGHDWVVIALAHLGIIKKIDIDTAHFKGNYPDRCSVQAARLSEVVVSDLPKQSAQWRELMPPNKLDADQIHHFHNEITDLGPITHIRLNIYPDGGVSRVRMFGEVTLQATAAAT